jgi:hypothetical protein
VKAGAIPGLHLCFRVCPVNRALFSVGAVGLEPTLDGF